MHFRRSLPEARSLSESRVQSDMSDSLDSEVIVEETVAFGIRHSREDAGELLQRLDSVQSKPSQEEALPLPDWVDDFDTSATAQVARQMEARLGSDKLEMLGDVTRLMPRKMQNHS